jgi:8-oxo-dGTP pyrophosphatase MutT (NUDIX family)
LLAPVARSRRRTWSTLSTRKIITQYAALPFALKNGRPRVMLVTSRGSGRWIIPKGWPEKELAPHDCAAKEAYEEAGVLGKINQRPLGTYRYNKRLRSRGVTTFEVKAYLLEVDRQLRDWPEKGQRETRWMAPARAAKLVSEVGLVELLLSVDRSHGRQRRRSAWTPQALQRLAEPLRALSRLARALTGRKRRRRA